jgi:RimJ/RimL family protein N-acetyltransferase
MPLEIRRLDPLDAPEYRTLRLRALTEFPLAFTSSFDEEDRKDTAWSARRLADPQHRFWGAFVRNEMAGMIGLERKPRQREQHKATVVGMYVAPEHGGQGIGKQLFAALLAEAQRMGLELLVLTVTEGNTQATRLYESLGFRSFGVEPDAIKVGGRGYGKDHMFLKLTP